MKPGMRLGNGKAWKTLGLGCLGIFTMGISMPSCPGQQALQQQVDTLQTAQTDATRKIQNLETQVKTLNHELTQVKGLLEQVPTTIQAQREALDSLNKSVEELKKAKSAPAPAASAKKAKALPKRRGH